MSFQGYALNPILKRHLYTLNAKLCAIQRHMKEPAEQKRVGNVISSSLKKLQCTAVANFIRFSVHLWDDLRTK